MTAKSRVSARHGQQKFKGNVEIMPLGCAQFHRKISIFEILKISINPTNYIYAYKSIKYFSIVLPLWKD